MDPILAGTKPEMISAKKRLMYHAGNLVQRYSVTEREILKAHGIDSDSPCAIYEAGAQKIQDEFLSAIERAFEDLTFDSESPEILQPLVEVKGEVK